MSPSTEAVADRRRPDRRRRRPPRGTPVGKLRSCGRPSARDLGAGASIRTRTSLASISMKRRSVRWPTQSVSGACLQPIVVRPTSADAFELVAGERRWRAAQIAGDSTIPALIDDKVDEAGSLELALIENVVREDLTPIEEARTIVLLLDDLEHHRDAAFKAARPKPHRYLTYCPPARPTRPSDRVDRRWRTDEGSREGVAHRTGPRSPEDPRKTRSGEGLVRPSARGRDSGAAPSRARRQRHTQTTRRPPQGCRTRSKATGSDVRAPTPLRVPAASRSSRRRPASRDCSMIQIRQTEQGVPRGTPASSVAGGSVGKS